MQMNALQVATQFYNQDLEITLISEELDGKFLHIQQYSVKMNKLLFLCLGDTMHVVFDLQFDNRAYISEVNSFGF